MNKVITDKKKHKKNFSKVHVFIGGIKPFSREKLVGKRYTSVLAPTSTIKERIRVQQIPQEVVPAKMAKVGTRSLIAPLSNEVVSTEKYSNYINYLKEQDDKDMDHMSWSLKRFSKKK